MFQNTNLTQHLSDAKLADLRRDAHGGRRTAMARPQVPRLTRPLARLLGH